jgi:hypothetical protein
MFFNIFKSIQIQIYVILKLLNKIPGISRKKFVTNLLKLIEKIKKILIFKKILSFNLLICSTNNFILNIYTLHYSFIIKKTHNLLDI